MKKSRSYVLGVRVVAVLGTLKIDIPSIFRVSLVAHTKIPNSSEFGIYLCQDNLILEIRVCRPAVPAVQERPADTCRSRHGADRGVRDRSRLSDLWRGYEIRSSQTP